MNPLTLSPLPTIRAGSESESQWFEREGFVDEAMVAELMCRHQAVGRRMSCPEDLILAADDLDFAGWQIAPAPQAIMLERSPTRETPARRPAPPMIEEPGLGQPHAGTHRWWLAGLAGVLSTMLFSLLLLTLASRPNVPFDSPSTSEADSVARPVREAHPPKAAPELTGVSAAKP